MRPQHNTRQRETGRHGIYQLLEIIPTETRAMQTWRQTASRASVSVPSLLIFQAANHTPGCLLAVHHRDVLVLEHL